MLIIPLQRLLQLLLQDQLVQALTNHLAQVLLGLRQVPPGRLPARAHTNHQAQVVPLPGLPLIPRDHLPHLIPTASLQAALAGPSTAALAMLRTAVSLELLLVHLAVVLAPLSRQALVP